MALVVGTNSYIDAADCTAYFADRLEGAEWDAASAGTKDQALISATDMLDRQRWKGEKFNTDSGVQPLDWPRTGLTDDEGLAIEPANVTDYPQFLLDATCQLALALIIAPTVATQTSTGVHEKRLKAGSAEIEFFFNSSRTSGSRFPVIVQELLGLYLEGSSELRDPFAGELTNTSSLKDYSINRGL